MTSYSTLMETMLSCGVVCVILRFAVLIQYRRVTHTQTQDDGIYTAL